MTLLLTGSPHCRNVFLLIVSMLTSYGLGIGIAQADDATASSPNIERSAAQAFALGQFEQAVNQYQLALANNPNDPRLNYNLGSALYKLQRYEQARMAFQRANVPGPTQNLARYNLGLVAIQQQRFKTARRWFNTLLASDAPESLKKLAEKATQLTVSNTLPLTPKATLRVSTAFGYDSNPLAQPRELLGQTGSSGSYQDFQLSYAQPFSDHASGSQSTTRGKDTLLLDLYLQHFISDSDNDFYVVNPRYRHDSNIGQFRTRAELGMNYLAIAGAGAQYSGNLQLSLIRAYGWGELGGYYQLTGYRSLQGIYTPQEGHQHQLELDWFGRPFKRVTTGVTLGYQHNRRRSDLVSPTRLSLTLNAKLQATEDLAFFASWRLRDSRFPAGTQRQEQQQQFSISGRWTFSQHWDVSSRVMYVNNNGEPNNFSYQREDINLRLQYRY